MHHESRLNSILAVLLAALLCAAACFTFFDKAQLMSYAVTQEEKDEAEQEAEEAKKATEAKRKEAKEAAKKAAEATGNFEEAEKKLDELAVEIEGINAQIAVTQEKITKTRAKMKKKQQDIEDQNEALGDRLTAMYKTGNAGFVDVILNSEDIEDLLTNVGMVQKITESDQNLLKKLKKDYKELAKLKKKLEQQQAELEDIEISLEAKMVETEELKKMYQAEADKYKAMEDELEAEAEVLAAEALEKQKKAEAMIVDQGGSAEALPPGAYAFPINSNWMITSNYGWRICPFHGREFHNGVDLVLTSGTMGSPVYAIADGVITRASWYGGYGNCIILQCGGGISALYGHLSGYACSEDQYVTRGTLIGYVGSTGNSTGPHLHFTVFQDGSHINPFTLY